MNPVLRYLVQAVCWLVLAGLVGLFGQGPAFAPVPPDHGELKISLAHLAERLEQCRTLTEAEREALPPTRRVTEICERGRASTHLRVILNGQPLVDRHIQPAGWHGGGRAYFQTAMPLPAGSHTLKLELADGDSSEAFSLQEQFSLELGAGESALLAIGDDGARLRHVPMTTETSS